MISRPLKITVLVFVGLLVVGIPNRVSARSRARSTRPLSAELLPAWRDAPQMAPSQPVSTPTPPQSQAISQTGLLPLVAVDINIDPSWVDGDASPSTSPLFSHNGVNDVVDQSWTTVKPAGFNAIRFPLHLDDAKSPVRLANLCLWATANGVRLIPVLQGTDAMRNNSTAMTGTISTFITSVISSLKGGATGLTPYSQISFYQLERPMNHTGLYRGMATATAQQLLVALSTALRQSETQALQGTGIQGTPICVAASYDFELIRQGAIAGVALDPAAEQRSQDSLKAFLKGFSSPNIDAINVEWFPRSISSGDVDHFVTLLTALKQSFSDKQITLTTGFSSAFNPPDQALQFYAAGISNLGSYRASDGIDSKFVGVVFQQAFKGINADLPTPPGTPDPSQWKWSDRAQQLSAMWTQGTASPDMTWWVTKVQDNMGLIAITQAAGTASSLTPLPTLQVLQEIASTLNQATQQLPPAATVVAPGAPSSPGFQGATPGAALPATGTPGYVPGAQPSTQAAGSQFQQLLFTLLQQFSQQIAVKLMTKMDRPNVQGSYMNPPNPGMAPAANGTAPPSFVPPTSTGTPTAASPIANTVWIAPSDVNVSTTSPVMGQSVIVTAQVHNQSSDQDISGLTVELVNPINSAASSQSVQSGVTVPRSGVVPVQLTWTPDATSVGSVQLVLQALDSNGQTVTTVAIPNITVQNTNSSPSSGAVANAAVPAMGTTITPAAGADPGSITNPTLPNNSGTGATSTGSTSGSTPSPAPVAQLTVTGFALADSSSSAAGQIPQLQAQVSNPSQLPTQSGQAQLFLDGTPQQMQTIGSILPSGTLILQFPAIQAATGAHNLQLVVTMADGVNASSTMTANVTAAAATTTTGTSSTSTSQPSDSRLRPPGPRTLRPVAPVTFRIGNVQTSTSPGGAVERNPAATSSALPHNPNAQAQSAAPSAVTTTATLAATPQRSMVRTITPVPTQATAGVGGNQSAAVSRVPAVRTILPGSAPAGSVNSTSPAARPALGTTNASPLATRTMVSGGVRTITPSTTSAVSTGASATQAAPRVSSTNTNSATRTIVPTATPTFTASAAPVNASMQPGTRTSATGFGMAGGLDLAISNQDVHLFPVSPRAGQTVMFTAAVKNSGTVAAQGARVLFVLVANGQRVASSQPQTFNVPAHGVIQAQWSTLIPATTSLQILVSVAANGDLNPANNQAMVPFAVALAPAKLPLKTH